MNSLAHWDFALSFSGAEIAALLAGVDPNETGFHRHLVDPILRRLDEAYREGLRECYDRASTRATDAGQERAGSALNGNFVAIVDKLAGAGADVDDIQSEVEGLWDRFEEDVFSRDEVTRWLRATGMKSAYQFDLRTFVKRDDDSPLPPRSEATYLTIIGALLELVRNPRPGRDSDAAVIRELIENYSDKPGISKTTLETKFADARRRLYST